jgi:hypothetical protein
MWSAHFDLYSGENPRTPTLDAKCIPIPAYTIAPLFILLPYHDPVQL